MRYLGLAGLNPFASHDLSRRLAHSARPMPWFPDSFVHGPRNLCLGNLRQRQDRERKYPPAQRRSRLLPVHSAYLNRESPFYSEFLQSRKQNRSRIGAIQETRKHWGSVKFEKGFC